MTTDEIIRLLVAAGGFAGLGAGSKALLDTVRAIRSGVSAREGKRKLDIVQQREEAIAQAASEKRKRLDAEAREVAADARADWADHNAQVSRANEQRAREHASDLRNMLMEPRDRPLRRDELPSWPDMEQTIPRAKLAEILKEDS